MKNKMILILVLLAVSLITFIFVSNKIESQKKEIENLESSNRNLKNELLQKETEIKNITKQCEAIENIEIEKEKDYSKNQKVINEIKKVIKNEGKEPEKVVIENFDDWLLWNRINELFGVSDSTAKK